MNVYLQLYWEFFKTGLFAVGVVEGVHRLFGIARETDADDYVLGG